METSTYIPLGVSETFADDDNDQRPLSLSPRATFRFLGDCKILILLSPLGLDGNASTRSYRVVAPGPVVMRLLPSSLFAMTSRVIP